MSQSGPFIRQRNLYFTIVTFVYSYLHYGLTHFFTVLFSDCLLLRLWG